MNSIPSDFLPILLLFACAAGFVTVVMVLTHFIGTKRLGSKHNDNFECGLPIVDNARQPISIKYFLTAILFVLFDVEVIFFYPYAVNFKGLGWEGLVAVLIFIAFFLCGFIYIIKKGALEWE
jgi:NADH-quinone oxidoreductase subunit A